MKTLLLLLAPAMLALSSCHFFNSHGEKVTIENSAVYYKGGATEDQAKALGAYLLQIGYFDKQSEKTVHLAYENGQHVLHLVVDQQKLSEPVDVAAAFWIMQPGLRQQVFNNSPIRIVLADAQLKTLHTIDPIEEYKASKTATVYYNSAWHKKADAEKLAAVFEEEGFFSFEGQQTIVMTKEENTNVVRIMADNRFLMDHIDALLPLYQVLLYDLTNDAFDNQKTTMYLTGSAGFESARAVPVPTKEEVNRILETLNQDDANTIAVAATPATAPENVTTPEFVRRTVASR